MKKLNLILVDYDERYLTRLNDYLSNLYKGKFEITCFTDKEIFFEYVKKLRYKDVLIINREIFDESVNNLGIKVVLQFVEEDNDVDDIKIIHKYKDINNIYDKVIQAYIDSNPKNVSKINSNDADTRIISLYSPIGGSGKSTIASTLSVALAERGNEVFYLNLEDIQSTNLYFTSEKYTSLSDVIFEIKDKSEQYIQKLLAGVSIDKNVNVSYLNPTENILDIEDMNNEDVKWLLEGIIKTKKYNYIVIDLGPKFNSLYNMVLNSSDCIITPIVDDQISNKKIEKLVSDINNLDKYYFVYNRCDNSYITEIPQCLSQLNISIDVAMIEDRGLKKSFGQDIFNNVKLKNFVYKIIENLEL